MYAASLGPHHSNHLPKLPNDARGHHNRGVRKDCRRKHSRNHAHKSSCKLSQLLSGLIEMANLLYVLATIILFN